MKIYLIKWRYEIRRTINMESMNEIAKFLGEARIEDLKDYIVDEIKVDIAESIHDSYIYIISPDEFSKFGDEVFNEVKEELKKKYKKQLKSVLEAKILKVIDDAEKAINKDKKEQGQKITLNDWSK